MNQPIFVAAAPAVPALVTTGTYVKDGIHLLPYALGVRLPYPTPAAGSQEETYDAGYQHGAYDASWRVGLGGLLAGAVVGGLLVAFARDR